MDSLTQAILGAAIGQAMLGKRIGGVGAIVGGIVATIPDLDVVLLPLYDSLEKISVHRGFSHSILFSILGALLIALILSRIRWTKQFSFQRLLLFTWLALFTHILLDAFTAYGTQLFLPFSDYRVSFDSITIVDPVYTLPLLFGLILTYYPHRKQIVFGYANKIGIIISTLYLAFTLGHKQYISNSIKLELAHQNINYELLKTIPVGVGNINWYAVAKSTDSLFIGKYSNFKNNHIDFHSFPINEKLLDKVDNKLAEKMRWFSQDFYTVAAQSDTIRLYNLQCDMQGIRTYGNYKAPTAFYFEITKNQEGGYELSSGMHKTK